MKDTQIEKTDLLILCGGRGKRLGHLTRKVPKPMLGISGKPFLELLIDYAVLFGFKRVILCSGYKGTLIKKHNFKNTQATKILFSHEKIPLGTAGAVKNAQKLIKSRNFLVMNGDSFCKIDLVDFLRFHTSKKSLCTIALSRKIPGSDVGSVVVGSNNRIIKFAEKNKTVGSALTNAGIYCFAKNIMKYILPGRKVSLEKEVFPAIINKKCYGYVTKASLVDIGTPRRYKEAKSFHFFNNDVYSYDEV